MTSTAPPTATDPWPIIERLVAWLDENNGRSVHEITLRLLKISEEAGEVAQAWIGYIGQNPRKGVTNTSADVADELCDVIVTAMVALGSVIDDPARHFAGKLAEIARKRGADTAPTIPPETANHVLFHFGHGGYEADTFTRNLITAIDSADMENVARLANAYPQLVAAVIAVKYDPDGVGALQRIAAGEGPVGCRRCSDTAGPYDLGTGLCENCLGGAA